MVRRSCCVVLLGVLSALICKSLHSQAWACQCSSASVCCKLSFVGVVGLRSLSFARVEQGGPRCHYRRTLGGAARSCNGVQSSFGRQRSQQRGSYQPDQKPRRNRDSALPHNEFTKLDTLNFADDQRQVEQFVLPKGWLDSAYENATRPLHIDIGCARGAFCTSYANRNPVLNVLGLEIMQRKVLEANQCRRKLGLTNCFFLLCDVNRDLQLILRDVQSLTRLAGVSINFPVPHLNRLNSETALERHRRLNGISAPSENICQTRETQLVTPDMVQLITDALSPSGFVFIQSEVQDVVLEMRKTFRGEPRLEDARLDLEEWLHDNPFSISSEWEQSVERNGKQVYRCLLRNRS